MFLFGGAAGAHPPAAPVVRHSTDSSPAASLAVVVVQRLAQCVTGLPNSLASARGLH
jgi:hypothetical protein